MKKTLYIGFLFALVVVSCAPGSGVTLPPDMTLIPGSDVPQQVATYISNALTQTAIPSATPMPYSATATPLPGTEAGASLLITSQILYASPLLGIQFGYPSTWYRQETSDGVFLSSFDPSNPPHKLEWAYETTSMQFGMKVFIASPSFETWVEDSKKAAQAEGWSLSGEERFLVANQPAARLSLVSGSGGILNRVLIYGLSGRYFEVNVEGNYNNNLAKAVLDSAQPDSGGIIKPSDAMTPASGVCPDAQGDPVNIVLGLDTSGLPLAGRCVAVNPTQRIKLINQSVNPVKLRLMEYPIALPVGGEILLDKPAGQYLAIGVHFLDVGPELWVKSASAPTFTPTPSVGITAPPPIVEYNNAAVGYRLNLPGDWQINETNNTGKEVIFTPPYADPSVLYLDIKLDLRTLDQIITSYSQTNATREDTILNGYSAIKYTFPSGSNTYVVPYGTQIVEIMTDRPNDSIVQSILMTFRYAAPPQPVTYDATMADNGRTFYMKVGDKLRINLDLSYGWSATSISDPAVIAGAADGYFAFANGTATLSTIGNPGCLNLVPPCGMPSILFTVTVVVQ